MANRKGNLTQKIETQDNFYLAEDNYADGKHKRRKVAKFERNRDENIMALLSALKDGTWQPAKYHDKIIVENHKQRKLCIYPMEEHVMEWAHTNVIEHILTDTYMRNSCSCVQGRGQVDFIMQVYHDLYNDYDGTYYFVQLDAHHFFPNVDHTILKRRLESKIKDRKVLGFLESTIDNYANGIVLGTKISQIEGNFYLVPFDYDAQNLFGIMDNPDRYAYFKKRYVDNCLITCRTEAQARELNKGVVYLNAKFDRLCREWIANKYVYRFADNILFLCSDKTFLHLVVEMAINCLGMEYNVKVNKSWRVSPVEPDGIDICGYVLFHDHIAVRKRDKQKLCAQVNRLRKKGLSPEDIRLQCASRLGWIFHADARNLLKSLNVNTHMKRLGQAIKERKCFIPFKGMAREQKEQIPSLICRTDTDEQTRTIMLKETLVTDSKAKRGEKCLWFRYSHVIAIKQKLDNQGRQILGEDGKPEMDYIAEDAEHFCCTGSRTLREQAEQDITDDMLPIPTAICERLGQRGSRYYKFT